MYWVGEGKQKCAFKRIAMLFQSQVFLPTTSVFHGLLSMNVGASKIVLSRLNDEMAKVKRDPYVIASSG